jgi:hypothetical protein
MFYWIIKPDGVMETPELIGNWSEVHAGGFRTCWSAAAIWIWNKGGFIEEHVLNLQSLHQL